MICILDLLYPARFREYFVFRPAHVTCNNNSSGYYHCEELLCFSQRIPDDWECLILIGICILDGRKLTELNLKLRIIKYQNDTVDLFDLARFKELSYIKLMKLIKKKKIIIKKVKDRKSLLTFYTIKYFKYKESCLFFFLLTI